MYLIITDEISRISPGVHLVDKLSMAEIVDFLSETIGLSIEEPAEQPAASGRFQCQHNWKIITADLVVCRLCSERR